MKSDKKLTEIYNKSKVKDLYYSFNEFKNDAKLFIKTIKKEDFICSMDVSRSGMQRKFNTTHFNAVLNICYNGKFTYDKVKVGGCGMDMLWNLLYRTCQDLCTKKEVEEWKLNNKCSRYTII